MCLCEAGRGGGGQRGGGGGGREALIMSNLALFIGPLLLFCLFVFRSDGAARMAVKELNLKGSLNQLLLFTTFLVLLSPITGQCPD